MAAVMMTITEIAGFVGAGLAAVAYVPQISRLRRTRCSAGISQLAFGIWLLASLLTTARAVTIHAGVFIMLGVRKCGHGTARWGTEALCPVRCCDIALVSHRARGAALGEVSGWGSVIGLRTALADRG